MSNNIMELDFTGIESFQLIPVGTHNVKVIGADFKKATTGSDQLELNFEDGNGATRKSWFSLLPQALWKVKQVLEALGVSCEGKVKINTKTLVGRTCQITVETDENDATRQIITKVAKIGTTVAPSQAFPQEAVQPAQVPQQAEVAGKNVFPSQTMSSPFNAQPVPQAVQAPVVEAPQAAPQGNLPPWMQQAAGNTAPQGNLPPWMQK